MASFPFVAQTKIWAFFRTLHFPSLPKSTPWQNLFILPLKYIKNPFTYSTATDLAWATIFSHLANCNSLSITLLPSMQATTSSTLCATTNVIFKDWELLKNLSLKILWHDLHSPVWSGSFPFSRANLGLPSPHSLGSTLMAIFQFPEATHPCYAVCHHSGE